ncbi:MAG: dihydrodipicolinate synthase family protein [Treponema sp.]|nr:dihydrodipicolinate synthase family protein [Treponema sp.]
MVALNRNGIYSALFTPFDAGGAPDLEKLRALIRYQLEHGVEGFYCCGSSGEGLLLEPGERKKILETVADEAGSQAPFIVHTGALSTRTAVELSVHAKDCGAAAVSLIPPIYYHYSTAEIERYYTDVADSVDIGVIVYNIPQFTGISFSKKNGFLRNPRIIGIKHTSMNLYDMERLRQTFPDKIIFNGHDEIWFYGLAAGADAVIGTTTNIFPKLFKKIREAFRQGNICKAQELQGYVNDFVEAVTEAGVFPGTKYCMSLLGIDLGPCRRPFMPLGDEEKSKMREALEKVKPWL